MCEWPKSNTIPKREQLESILLNDNVMFPIKILISDIVVKIQQVVCRRDRNYNIYDYKFHEHNLDRTYVDKGSMKTNYFYAHANITLFVHLKNFVHEFLSRSDKALIISLFICAGS